MTETSFRIVILGGGTAGWMSAAALARFVPPGYSITLIESDAIGTVGVGEATIPPIRLFNEALGIDEADFLRETSASYKLGIEFAGWLRDGHSYMHAFGAVGRQHGLLPFRHYWARASAVGNARPLGHYSANEIASMRGYMQRFCGVMPKRWASSGTKAKWPASYAETTATSPLWKRTTVAPSKATSSSTALAFAAC